MWSKTGTAWSVLGVLAMAGLARADTMFLVSNTTNQVYRFDVNPSGTPALLGTIADASFSRPYGLSMRPNGDLQVISRGPCTDCAGGGITPIDTACGVLGPTLAPSMTGFRTPHDAAVRGDELVIIDSYAGRIRRYLFDGAGSAVPNGDIVTGMGQDGRGLTFWAGGDEMLVSGCCGSNNVRRYQFNADGSISTIGSFNGNGLSNPHGLVVGPNDELFVANANGNSVSRFFLTPSGAIANGVITGSGLSTPIGVAFSPWGELFVTNGDSMVRRFTFDGSGNAVPNGSFATPTPCDDLLFITGEPEIARQPESVFTCPSGSATLSITPVGANAGAPFSVQWRKDGLPIGGATGLTYTIPAVGIDETGSYDCVVTNSCGGSGTLTSRAVTISICTVDLNCDGVVDFGDYLEFLNRFDGQDLAVDFTQDGLVDFGDYLEFLNLYDAGC